MWPGDGPGGRLMGQAISGATERTAHSPNSLTTQTLLPSEASRVAILLYFWLAAAVLCGLGSLDEIGSQSMLFFVLTATSVQTCFMVLTAVMRRQAWIFAFASYLALLVLPVLLLPATTGKRLIFLDLLLVLLIALPVVFRVWSWKLQTAASLLAVASSGVLVFENAVGNHLSLLMVATTSILAFLVTFNRREETARETRTVRDLDPRFQETLTRVKESQFQSRMWRTPLLQGGLVVLMIAVDFCLGMSFDVALVGKKVNVLIVIILGMLFLRVVRSRYIMLGLLLMTLAVAIAVTAARTIPSSTLYAAMPIIYIAFTTAILPSFLERQVIVTWWVTIIALLSQAIVLSTGVVPNLQVIESTFLAMRDEIILIISGASTSLVVSLLLEQHHIAHFSRSLSESMLRKRSLKESSLVMAREPLPGGARAEFRASRSEHFVGSLLMFGLGSSLLTSVLLTNVNPNYWFVALLEWAIYLAGWFSLYYLVKKDPASERVPLLAGLLSFTLFIIPASLIAFGGANRDFWVFLPLGLLLGFGAAPWSITEAFSWVGLSYFCGLEILFELDVVNRDLLLLSLGALLSITVSTQLYRRIAEASVLGTFHDSVHRANSPPEVIRMLADSLGCLFGSHASLVSLGRGHVEVVRDGIAYRLASKIAWPLVDRLRNTRTSIGEANGVGTSILNWLPANFSFFDVYFGEFAAHHGVLVVLRPISSWQQQSQLGDLAAMNAPVEKIDDEPFLVFVPSRFPLVRNFWKRNPTGVLASMVALRLRGFAERELRRRERDVADASRAEREYELGTLVHDINNTVQDLTLLCDGIGEEAEKIAEPYGHVLLMQMERVVTMARSMATVVSDAKRRRELERLSDLTPRELIEVNQVVREVVEFARIRGERRRVEVRCTNLEQHEPYWTRISAREHLETILRNLLNNAIIYTQAGTTVDVSIGSDEKWVRIEVSDNGPGLSQEECQRIFLSGVRGKLGLSVPGGLGLGLSQSRRVAESAGGTIKATSAGAGRGSTFTVTLPRHAPPAAVGRAGDCWALIVEDQPSLSEFYARIAKALHLQPAVASSTTEAEALVGEHGRPTFVLTDLHLGGTDGFELVRSLRKQFDDRLPILVVSGLNDDNVEQRAKEAGATDFVAKPVGRRVLFARIQSLLPSYGM